MVKSAIGIYRQKKQRTAEQRTALIQESIGVAIDASQLARAISGGEYARAKKQQSQLVKRLNKLRL